MCVCSKERPTEHLVFEGTCQTTLLYILNIFFNIKYARMRFLSFLFYNPVRQFETVRPIYLPKMWSKWTYWFISPEGDGTRHLPRWSVSVDCYYYIDFVGQGARAAKIWKYMKCTRARAHVCVCVCVFLCVCILSQINCQDFKIPYKTNAEFRQYFFLFHLFFSFRLNHTVIY
jgi:hypothetical protein